jgi:hypothetical protein
MRDGIAGSDNDTELDSGQLIAAVFLPMEPLRLWRKEVEMSRLYSSAVATASLRVLKVAAATLIQREQGFNHLSAYTTLLNSSFSQRPFRA